MRDIAIVSFAEAPLDQPPGMSETTMLLPTITEALERVGMTRRDVRFTCSGSADYLTGGTFTFVQMLEAAGAWPPISESHVEMDGAWALYEAWVRLQHGDIDIALVFASGRAGLSVSLRETLTFQLDPYYLVPLGADYVSLSALQAQAVLAATGRTETRSRRDRRARSRRDATGNPNAAVSGDFTVDDLLAKDYVVAPLREHDIGPPVDGAAAVVLVAGDRARDLVDRPAWIAGIDHRADPHYPGVRDLSKSPSTATAAERAGVGRGGVEVAELTTVCSSDELLLADALGLGADVSVNPSGGALVANPTMVTGLARIGAAFRHVQRARQATRARARELGSVPATEPRLRRGGTVADGRTMRGCRHRQTKMAKCRDDVSFAGLVPRGRGARARRRGDDVEGRRGDRHRHRARHLRRRDDARAVPRRRARRGRQADHARAHRGQRRRLDGSRRHTPRRSRASTSAC